MEKRLSIIMLVLFVVGIPFDVVSKVAKINDKSKMYQVRSMEDGKWEFHPGIYYITRDALVGDHYSGGYWKGLNIRWSVSKSRVGQVGHLRVSQAGVETLSSSHIQAELDTVTPLAKEEINRVAEREIDAAYVLYSSTFKELIKEIDEMLLDTNVKSEGMLAMPITDLIDEKNLIEEEIDYIHKFGPTAQMENAKRELAYEEVEKKLRGLYSKAYKLLYYSQTMYNSNH